MGGNTMPVHSDGRRTKQQVAACMVFDDMLLWDNDTADVVWDEEKQHTLDHPGLLKQLAQGGNYFVGEYDATKPEYVQFMDSMKSKGASNMMLDEMQNMPVVWDDELLHGLDCQDASVQKETQFDKCLDVDNNTAVNLGIRDMLPHSSDMDNTDNLFTDIPLEVRWDEEMQSDVDTNASLLHVDTNASLLQQQVLSVDDEKRHTVRLNTSVVLNRADTSPLLKQCMGTTNQVCGGFPNKVMVWDEKLFHQHDSHDGLLQQLAGSRESIDGKKAKGVIEVDTDKVLTHISGLSHFLEICETSNADEEGELVAEVLTHESGLIQHLEISISSANHGLEEMLELDDQVSCETLCVGNENLQPREVYVACLGMMPPSAGCMTDQFSPQCLNHQFQSHLCLSSYGTWADQEMESDCKDSVIFYGKQEIHGSAHYVASTVALQRRNALSLANPDTKATCSVFNKIFHGIEVVLVPEKVVYSLSYI